MDQIIEHVYAAALDRSAWPTAIDAIQNHFSGASTGLYLADMRQASISMVHLQGIAPDYVDTYVDRYLTDNPWSFVADLQLPGRVRTDLSLDQHYNDRGYYRRTSFFNDWMEPQDFIHTLGVNLAVDRHIQTKVYVYRSARTGSFTRRDVAEFARISRHLHNAVQVARRLALEEARSRDLLDVVEHLNFGVVLLTERGRITHANGFAQQLFGGRDGLVADEGMLAAAHRDDNVALTRTVRSALDATAAGAGEAMTALIRRPGFKRPLSVLAVPLPRTRDAPFPTIRRAAVALIVTDPERDAAVPTDSLRARYNFSATEARLAQSLSRGVPLREAADTTGLTYETARWYLKGMFQKTGTARQADLVRLMIADHWLVS
jgi:DNA-binding CsgD family transcriptional regulator/PAS domain-containing protein